jgi:hypothetical protein
MLQANKIERKSELSSQENKILYWRRLAIHLDHVTSGGSRFVLLSHFLSQVQAQPSPGVVLRTLFRHFDSSTLFYWSQGINIPSLVQIDYDKLTRHDRHSLKTTEVFIPYRKENTTLHRYKDQPVNAV